MITFYVPSGDSRAYESALYLTKGDESRVRLHGIGDPIPADAAFMYSDKNVRGYLELHKLNGTLKKNARPLPFAMNALHVIALQRDLLFANLRDADGSTPSRQRKYAQRFKSGLDCLYHALTGERMRPKRKKVRRTRQLEECGIGPW